MTGGPPQQAPPVSVPSSMPGPPGGAMGAPMRGPPPPRPPMGSMPPGGMYDWSKLEKSQRILGFNNQCC